MAKIELGFEGERFLYIPNPCVSEMENSPLTNDLYLYSLGYFSRAAHHYIRRPDGCNEYLFIYCTGGCGWVELYGVKMKLGTNQFIILPPNIAHCYWADESSPWTIYWIHFRGSKASCFSQGFDSPTTIEPSAQSRIEERLDMFDEMFSVLNESLSLSHLHYANLCLAHFLGSFLYRDIYCSKFRRKEYSENVMKRVIHYMNDNLECRLTMKDLSSFSGYSDSYLYRKFKKETGYAPMDYYIRQKIKKACKLLIQTDMKINQIACKLGFREPQYFSRTFTHVMGLSAKEYRIRNRE